MDTLINSIVAGGAISEDQVAGLRQHLYTGGEIDRADADAIFALNDALRSIEGNHASWQALFIEALCDHVLRDDGTAGVVDEAQAVYLTQRILKDGSVDPNGLNLLAALCATATAGSPHTFNQFVLDSLKAAIILDGCVSKSALPLLKKVIYGAGGAGVGVDRAEGDLLFDINDATNESPDNDPAWESFLTKAIMEAVFNDENSPDVLDDEEAQWIVKRVEGNTGFSWWARTIDASYETPSELVRDPSDWIDLTPSSDFRGWTRIPIAPDGPSDYVQWSVDEGTGVITCKGDGVHEWLRYDTQMGDFVLHVEWRCEGRNGNYNSGIGVRMSPLGEIYYQAQTKPTGGYLFGDTIKDGRVQRVSFKNPTSRRRIHPEGEWNTFELRCTGSAIVLWVNGADVNKWDNIAMHFGHLALEAEGYLVQFRNVRLKHL